MIQRRSTLFLGLALVAGQAFGKAGDSQNLGEKDWSGVNGMAGHNGKLYVATDGGLWEVEKSGVGKKMAAPKDMGQTYRVASLDGKLYAIAEGKLYEVDKGRFRVINDDIGAKGMVGMDKTLYLVRRDALTAVTTEGQASDLGGDWYAHGGIAALNGKLYIMSRDQLFAVGADGKGAKLGDSFSQTSLMAASGGKLYVFARERTEGQPNGTLNEARIWEVDPASGTRTSLPLPKGMRHVDGITAMAALDGKLYLSMPGMSRSTLFSLSLQ